MQRHKIMLDKRKPVNNYTYTALEVKQKKGAKPFFLTSINAEEILEWADVPRKRSDYLVGYQRELQDRYKNITKFLDLDDENIIPGTIIIALNKDCFSVEDLSLDSIKKIIISDRDITFDESLYGKYYESFYKRLNEDEKRYIDEPEEEVSEEDLNADNDDDESLPKSYLASITKELKNLSEGKSIPEEREKSIQEFLQSIAKPGLILDGQHRVFGAKNSKEYDEINLPVLILPEMPASEQVFHFYILNNKAKPLNKTELRAVVSTSLSNKEIEELYHRFRQAGVHTEEARWTHATNTDNDSPFKNLIDFGFSTDSKVEFIPENVAFQVVKAFVKPNKKYKALYENEEQWTINGIDNYDYRLKMFYCFWRTIKEVYPEAWKQAVENHGGQVLMKVNMLVLQEMIFDKLNETVTWMRKHNLPMPFSSCETLSELIKTYIEKLNEDFYLREWKQKGLDTSTGQKLFRDQLETAVRNESKNLGNMTLFKQQND